MTKPKRAGKKKGGLGEGIFARPPKFLAEFLPGACGWLKVGFRIFVKISSDFVQKVPPIYNFNIFESCCLALATLGLGRNEDFIRIFEIQKQFLPAQTEVRFGEAKGKTKFCKPIFFLSPKAKGKAII